jgi:N utilization substance protein A
MIKDAKKLEPAIELGGELLIALETKDDYGRIAAQTAKQVIIQRIREAEREVVFETFKEKEGDILSASVQRIERGAVYLDIGKTTGILFPEEQIPQERYRIGQRLRVFVVRVDKDNRGPAIILSRKHPKIIEKLFELEVPEIASGVVEIKAIAREAGSRSKVAVASNDPNIDPVGSCVGQRGIRVSAVINELGGENIDIIMWSDEEEKLIANALSPAKVLNVDLDEAHRIATVDVSEDQLSLAIGKRGQNVRLAAELTGWKIDVKGTAPVVQAPEKEEEQQVEESNIEQKE